MAFGSDIERLSAFLRDKAVRVKPADVILTVEKELTLGSFHFQLLETPGHSPGSLSYYSQELEAVFVEIRCSMAVLVGQTSPAETMKIF